jgi:hypothetical protein
LNSRLTVKTPTLNLKHLQDRKERYCKEAGLFNMGIGLTVGV